MGLTKLGKKSYVPFTITMPVIDELLISIVDVGVKVNSMRDKIESAKTREAGTVQVINDMMK